MRAHEVLAALPDVARLTVHAGQVLVYPRHTPPGIFIVVVGVVCRFADGTLPEAECGDRLDAASGAFAVPAPGELAEPAKAGVRAVTDVEILFVPRSVVLSRSDVPGTLAAADVAVVSLGEIAVGSSPTTVTRRRAR
jgi:CRP-like cAMP-binding protein